MFACLHSRAHTHTLCKHQWGVEDKTERKAREDEFNDIFSATGKREKEKRKEREREREREVHERLRTSCSNGRSTSTRLCVHVYVSTSVCVYVSE